MRKGVQKIFSEVAETYELVNHVLTLGLDMRWRKKAARLAARAGGSLWLDICSGTGEMALYLSRLANEGVRVVSVDFCRPMMVQAMKRNMPNILFIQADAGRLPFPDRTFDLITISFATRNIAPNLEVLTDHLKEFHRLLKPGGCFLNLETSQPSSRIMRRLFRLYISLAVKRVGTFLSGSRAGYSYLAYTIPRFFPPDEFCSILRRAGFGRATYRAFLFGVCAIHTAWKQK